MPPTFHATPLAVPREEERHATLTLHALDVARFVQEHHLLSAFAPEGLTPATIDTWVAVGLVHRGRVTIDTVNATSITYLALTTVGARALSTVSGRPARGIRPTSLRRSPQTRAHEVAKGAIALTFLALEREGRVELVGIEADDKRLATSVVLSGAAGRAKRVGLQADLLVVLRRAAGNIAYLVEVDRGTVSATTMQAKYAAYAAWKAGGGPERDFGVRALRVLTVVPNARRLDRLHAAALEAVHGKRSGFFLFALQERFTAGSPGTLLEPIARVTAPGDEGHVALVDEK